LYDEIEAMVLRDGVATLRAVLSTLALRGRYGLPLQAPFISTTKEAVLVMTAHRSKGLEFGTVFIPHVQDSNWGGRVTRNLFSLPLMRYASMVDPGDDERRLLYVALTRAKERLYISTAAMNIDGKEVIASRLLVNLADDVLENKDIGDFEKNFSPTAALVTVDHSVITSDTLLHLLTTRGLSATSFNTLLKNPWDFLYRNLLRVPETKTLSLQFGTVIHAVLEKVTAYHTDKGSWPNEKDIVSWLEAALRRQPFSTTEYTQVHEKGLTVLMAYLSHLERNLVTLTKEEFSIRTVFTTEVDKAPEIVLTGKLDRLDLNENGEAVRVVDYKTGKPKTRAAIEGGTSQHDGSYKRQLVFYALLLSLQDDERYHTREGVLSFVEPTTHGEIKEESFVITDDEISALSRELNTAIAGFIRGDFLTDQALAESSAYASLALALINR
jgi:DNA helicase-2/ATP-dependent DNA helicase PcrA